MYPSDFIIINEYTLIKQLIIKLVIKHFFTIIIIIITIMIIIVIAIMIIVVITSAL